MTRVHARNDVAQAVPQREALLKTKLYAPPVRAEFVSRPRLVERLDAGLRPACKLTLVSAPAGFGKTTLLANWKLTIENCRMAWVSLDKDDNDPIRFWAYCIAALETAVPDLQVDVPGALVPQAASFEVFLTRLINQLSLVAGPLVLVLDDYHVIETQAIHDSVTFLIDHLPPHAHLYLAARGDPPLPLARLRARGQLVEVRQADLSFMPDEASAFLRQALGLTLTPQDVAALNARTEGWVAGLQMASLALQGTMAKHGVLEREILEQGNRAAPETLAQAQSEAADFIRAFTGDHRYILDYLGQEILQRQPEHIQRFLLQTSILTHLTGALCNAVTGECGGEAMLEHLERANLFLVSLDDERQWYRYHRLFADLLRHRLQRAQPDLAPTLHLRASEWYEQQIAATGADSLMAGTLSTGAIEHATAAQDAARAARLIEQAAPAMLVRGEIATLLRWLDLLPLEAVRARPRLRLYQAMTLLMSGQSPDAVEAILREVEGDAESSGAFTGEVTALHALSAAYEGDAPRAAQLARQALALLPEDNLLLRGFAIGSLGLSYLWGEDLDGAVRTFEEGARIGEKVGNTMFAVIALRRVGRLRMAQGRLHDAQAVFDHALELAVDRRGRRLPIAGLVLIAQGYLAREWNDLDTAVRYLSEGIELARESSAVMTIGAHLVLARVRQAQGDPAGAQQTLPQAAQLAAQTKATDLDDVGVAMSRAQLGLDQGDLYPAIAWAKSRGLDQPVDALVEQASEESARGLIRRYEIPVLAKLLLAQQRPSDALRVLDLVLPRVEREGRWEVVIQVEILRALAFQAAGHPAQAFEALERALSLAEPSGYIRLFVDEGDPLKSLIADFRFRSANQKLCAYADSLLAAFGAGASSRPLRTEIQNQKSAIVESLTERELQVLRLLAAGLSNPEMAERLCLTVNTVRSHVKSIYGKLNVHGRYEATVKAQELRLL